MRPRLLLPRLIAVALIIVALIVVAAAVSPLPAAAEQGFPRVTALWVAPTTGELSVTRPFAPPPTPFAAGHRGVDLGGARASPVLAAGDGVVVFAGMVAGRPVVSIDHSGGVRTTYEPVAPSVAAGQRVTRGSPIGTLAAGHTGCPREACLHWGLRRGETYLDPMSLLEVPRVRLLPLAYEARAVPVRRGARPARSSSGPARRVVRRARGDAAPRPGGPARRR